eukprot:c3349_g1_i1.p1 GENE.c3349_g1_i1~~c3349_g1_i1.p1  ORF type:complete len:277 (-),score=63.11 c3349_g1_i1:85-915(-)
MQNKLQSQPLLKRGSTVTSYVDDDRTRVVDTSLGSESWYMSESKTISNQIAKLNQNIQVIEEHHNNAINSFSMDKLKVEERVVNSLVPETTHMVASIKSHLEALDKDVQTKRAKSPQSPETRMAASVLGTLGQRLLDAVTRYNATHENFHAHCQERIERQLKLVNMSATPEQVGRTIREGADAFEHTKIGEANTAFLEAQEKTTELHHIETQLGELRQLMVDLHTLLTAQGEILDTIEGNVALCADYTSRATSDLRLATDLQTTARRKMCFGFCCS